MKFTTYILTHRSGYRPIIAVFSEGKVYAYYNQHSKTISVRSLRTIAAGLNIMNGAWRINASKTELTTEVDKEIENKYKIPMDPNQPISANSIEETLSHHIIPKKEIPVPKEPIPGWNKWEAEPTPEKTTPQPQEEVMGEGVFEKAIQAAISGELSKKLNDLEKRLKENTTKEIVIKGMKEEPIKIGRQHKAFEKILKEVNIGHGVFMTGPAGSGKTTIAANIATALDSKFGCLSVCSQTTATAFVGYKNATGEYIGTDFRRIFEGGGVFLLDEVDAGNPNVITLMNSALDNGYCAFPDKVVKAHADFRVILSGNTFGTGADSMYVGRNRLDGATLSRFSSITVDYDEEFERLLSGNMDWCNYVITIRKAVSELQLNRLITPRASIKGARSLKAGQSRRDVEDMHVWKGMPIEEIRKIKAHIKTKEQEEQQKATKEEL